MKFASCIVAIAIGTLVPFVQGMAAVAGEIRIVASPGISGVLGQVGPLFERASGHTLAIQYGLVPAQKQQIGSGEFDLAIVPSFVLDEAITQGKIAAGSRTAVARALVAVGVRAGTAKPDVSSLDAFKRVMLAAKSVSYVTNEPTGVNIAKGFERLGIAEAMNAKTKSQESVQRVWQAVANGDVELGFGFTSNALAVPGVEVAGPFPEELQFPTIMAAGIGSSARQADAAKALITYLLSSEVAAVIKAKGLEPPKPQ